MLGRGYVIDHCIAFFKREKQELQYKYYIADVLRIVAEMSGRSAGYEMTIQGIREYMGNRDEDDRTGDDIAEDIIKRAGLKVQE